MLEFCCLLSFTAAGAGAAWANAADGLEAFRTGHVAEALSEWEAGAAAGDTVSLLYVASAYDQGIGVGQDFTVALDLYRRAAEHGNAAAALDVGIMFDAGRGAARDPVEALRWYRRAAKLGSGRAAYDLGLMLEQGDGTRPDKAGAVAAFRRALALGIPAAERHLDLLGAPRAARPLVARPAALHDDPLGDAQRTLKRSGLTATQVDRLSQSAANGDGNAAFDLGFAYENGLGVTVDPALALLWYGEASKHTTGRIRQYADRAAARLRADARKGER